MARPCTVCTHSDHETIDQDLVSGTPYRAVAKRHGVGVSSVFRHRRDHLTELMAKAVEVRGVRDLEYGDDLLGQLQSLNGRAMSILDDAETSGDRRTALAAIREVRSIIELNGKLCGQIQERHLHLHAHEQLSPEAHQQFMQGIEIMRGFTEKCLPQGDIRDDVHLLEGEAALPKATSIEELDELP